MALFKISRGSKSSLPTTLTEGYCWYTYDDSKFYIDFKDASGTLLRKALNANEAEKLTGYDIATILNSSDVEIPTSKAVFDAITTVDNKVDALIGPYSEGLAYTLKDDGAYEVAGIGTCTDTYVVIPYIIDEKRITSIGSSAFEDCSSLTSITIPDNVTSIGNSAFSGCSSLTSIMIPDSVTSIGDDAFEGCSSLTSITIPDSVTSIGNSAFCRCSSLTNITIPDSVTSIGSQAFYGCSNLTSITIPDSVTSIGWSAFFKCTALTSITIPNSVTSIGDAAFSGCSISIVIYCEAESRPEGWATTWNRTNLPVVWGVALDFPSVNDKFANCATTEYVDNAVFSGNYNDLTNKPIIPTIPTNVSAFNNDAGYLTSYTETDPTVPAWAKAASKPTYSASEVGAIPSAQKGAKSGVATLDENGKVPTSQLPSYVDDVLEYSAKSSFPATGEAGKIYVDTATNKTYRWSGSAYVEISASLALGTTSSTAYRGDYGNTAYTHSQKTSGNPHGVTKSDVGLGSVINTGDSATPVSGGTTKFTTGGAYTELAKKADKSSLATVATSGSYNDLSNKPTSMAPTAHNQASSTINAMAGYSKPSSTGAIATTDTLNAAIGKLEKALDGKQASGSYVTTTQFESALGAYINDIDALLGGD